MLAHKMLGPSMWTLVVWSLGCTQTIKPTRPLDPVYTDKCGSAVACFDKSVRLLDQARSEYIAAREAVGKLENRVSDSLTGMKLEVTVPVGTIVAYAGKNEPKGWAFCDGRMLLEHRYDKLIAVLGSNRMPDLRGQFLRGVRQGGEVLKPERWATGLPNKAFELDIKQSGGHTHTFYLDEKQTSPGGGLLALQSGSPRPRPANVLADGMHTHAISMAGGDPETRPDNTAVNFIIYVGDGG